MAHAEESGPSPASAAEKPAAGKVSSCASPRWRNIGLLSLLFTERHIQGALESPAVLDSDRLPETRERTLRLEAQFRF